MATEIDSVLQLGESLCTAAAGAVARVDVEMMVIDKDTAGLIGTAIRRFKLVPIEES